MNNIPEKDLRDNSIHIISFLGVFYNSFSCWIFPQEVTRSYLKSSSLSEDFYLNLKVSWSDWYQFELWAFSCHFSRAKGIVSRPQTASNIIVTFKFSMFCHLSWRIQVFYLTFWLLLYLCVVYWNGKIHKISSFVFVNELLVWSSGRVLVIRLYRKIQIILCISFSKTDCRLCKKHLFWCQL